MLHHPVHQEGDLTQRYKVYHHPYLEDSLNPRFAASCQDIDAKMPMATEEALMHADMNRSDTIARFEGDGDASALWESPTSSRAAFTALMTSQAETVAEDVAFGPTNLGLSACERPGRTPPRPETRRRRAAHRASPAFDAGYRPWCRSSFRG